MRSRGVLFHCGLAVRIQDISYVYQKDMFVHVFLKDKTKIERYVHSHSLRNRIIRDIDNALNGGTASASDDEDDEDDERLPPKRTRDDEEDRPRRYSREDEERDAARHSPKRVREDDVHATEFPTPVELQIKKE